MPLLSNEEIRERFENTFDEVFFDEDLGRDGFFPLKSEILDFFLAQRNADMEYIKGEVENRKQGLPDRICRNAEMEMFGRCFDCEKIKGFNQALDDLLSTLNLTNQK